MSASTKRMFSSLFLCFLLCVASCDNSQLGEIDSRVADLEAAMSALEKKSAMEAGRDAFVVDIRELEYELTERRFWPVLLVKGNVQARDCPCAKYMKVVMTVDILQKNVSVATKSVEALLMDGFAQLDFDIVIDNYDGKEGDFSLRFTPKIWYEVHGYLIENVLFKQGG